MLLCTAGTRRTAQALETGAQLASQVAAAVDILAVPKRGREGECRRQIQAATTRLEASGLQVNVHVRRGSFAREVIRQASAEPYDLVVTASPERRGIVARLVKPAALEVAEQVPASVLVVNGQVCEFRRFLVCTSAGPASEQPIRFAADLARRLGAAVTLIHVMSQVPLSGNAAMADLNATADELIRHGSREGVHLGQMLALLKAEGVAARAVIRHGLVLDEILAEAQEGPYDLLVVGSHITPGIRPFLVENLSADVVLTTGCPVLIVRGRAEERPGSRATRRSEGREVSCTCPS